MILYIIMNVHFVGRVGIYLKKCKRRVFIYLEDEIM